MSVETDALRLMLRQHMEALESALAGESAALEEAARLRNRLQCLDGETWFWADDSTDDLASMSDNMAVKLLAHDIRKLVGDAVAVADARWTARLERLRALECPRDFSAEFDWGHSRALESAIDIMSGEGEGEVKP